MKFKYKDKDVSISIAVQMNIDKSADYYAEEMEKLKSKVNAQSEIIGTLAQILLHNNLISSQIVNKLVGYNIDIEGI